MNGHQPVFKTIDVMKFYPFFVLLVIAGVSSCTDRTAIVKTVDYAAYLKEGILVQPIDQVSSEISFWESRLQADTGSYVAKMKLGAGRLQLFKLTGDPAELAKADSLFEQSSVRLNHTDPDLLYTSAQTAITRHQFQRAAGYNLAASQAKGDPFVHQLIGFDAAMELGQFTDARIRLHHIRNNSSFDYLIRKAKSADQQGDLDEAIRTMEAALELVKNKKTSLYTWTLSCLGDMYGHDGRPEDAYKAYLSVLKKDPAYFHALRGIAWIAYSHDHNADAALEIISYLQRQTRLPELWLTKAEIMEWQNDTIGKDACLAQFAAEMNHPDNGDMYNKYKFFYYADDVVSPDRALQLAKEEVNHRQTPDTYDWLAWAYFKRGEIRHAAALSRKYVYEKTSSPEAIYHTAMIFSASGQHSAALELLKQCTSAGFELGPIKDKMIRQEISRLESM